MTERLRVVIDSNILISRLLLKNSLPARAVDLALEIADVLVSDACLEELGDVLSRAKFDRYLSIEERQVFLRRYMQIGQAISVHTKLNASRDERDNKFLELAVDGEAHCILSGDQDLLALHPFGEIAILDPAAFIAAYA